jgi:hypothetical protein
VCWVGVVVMRMRGDGVVVCGRLRVVSGTVRVDGVVVVGVRWMGGRAVGGRACAFVWVWVWV